MAVIEVSERDFEAQVLRAQLPVFIDFFATWCAPCKTYAPIVEAAAQKYDGQIAFVKVDIDKCPQIAQALQVTSVPTSALFKNGAPVAIEPGVKDAAALDRFLEPVMPRAEGELKAKELAQLLKSQQVVPIDIRDEKSFGRFHIPGAVHVLGTEIALDPTKLAPIDGKLRVLYDRTDENAKQLAIEVANRGVQVGFLAGGFLGWEAEGLEVERGT